MYPQQEQFQNQQQQPLEEKKQEELKKQFEQNFIPKSQVQIIDCYQEITKKNYLPFILAVTEHKLDNKNGLDEFGYNALHYASSQNYLLMSKILIEELGLDPNFQSKNLQTPLMLAINIGATELASYFIELAQANQFQEKDSCGFTHLIYSAKSNQIPFFLYFFNEGIDINARDNSGCSVAHWAAYQNHLDMLKIIERLTGNLKVEDNQKFTPLRRAEENCSFKTAQYIQQKFEQKQNFYSKAPLLFSSLIYIILSIIFYLQFYNYLKDKSSYFGTLFTILFIYFQGIFLYFICNGKYNLNKLNTFQESEQDIIIKARNEGFPEIDTEILKSINFTKLNQALGISSESYNYMHYTISYLEHLDFSRYCPFCLKYMHPQTHHSKQLNTCIKHYSHYSNFFGRVINNQNHLLYYCLIGLQEILMILYIYCEIYSFKNQFTSYYLASYFETAYFAYTKNGLFNFLIFVLISYLLVINTYYFILETYGIFINQTRNEIFNRFKYRYLYKAVINKKNIVWNYYTNAQSNGINKNIKNYLAKALNK